MASRRKAATFELSEKSSLVSSDRTRSPLSSPGKKRLFSDQRYNESDVSDLDKKIATRLDAFAARMEAVMDQQFTALNTQLAAVQLQQGELRSSLVQLDNHCTEAFERSRGAELRADQAHDRADELEKHISALQATVNDLQNAIDRREHESNVIISGLAESAKEDLKNVVKEVASKMDLHLEAKDIVDVNRLGRPLNPAEVNGVAATNSHPKPRPRIVKVQFSSRHVARRFLSSSKVLRDTSASHIFVNEDLPPRERDQRRKLVPIYRLLRQSGVRCLLKRATLVNASGNVMTREEIADALGHHRGQQPAQSIDQQEVTPMRVGADSNSANGKARAE